MGPGALDGGAHDVVPASSVASSVYMTKFLEGVRGLLQACSARLDHVDFAGLRKVASKVRVHVPCSRVHERVCTCPRVYALC